MVAIIHNLLDTIENDRNHRIVTQIRGLLHEIVNLL